MCNNPNHNAYPIYGVAPHDCYWRIGKQIGQSEIKPQNEWPDNFAVELLDGEKPEDLHYPNVTGVYFCPTCKQGMDSALKRGDLAAPHFKEQSHD